MKELLLGVDIGTGGCKTTIIDIDGNFIADGYTEYPSYHYQPGWFEEKADEWLPAMVSSLQTTLARGRVSADMIMGMAIDSSAHNAVLLDKNDFILRNTIMWPDQRSVKEVEFLKENYQDMIRKATFHLPSPTWTLPQLMWVRDNEPQVFRRMNRVMFVNDYVRYQLTGVWGTDHIQAQGSLLFDNNSWSWSKDICDICGISLDVLPQVSRPTDIAGYITREAAALTGLKEGMPVIVGASDTAMENYSVGGVRPGDCVMKMATAGTINVFRTDATAYLDTFMYSHVVDGVWYCCRGTSSAAHSLRWYRDVFCQEEIKLEKNGGMDVYQLLDKEAAMIPNGCDGLFFHPYLTGERAPYWDAKLRGSFVGFSALHGRGHFNRAILEGVAYSLRQCFSEMEAFGRIDEIRFLGGGAKSPLWRSILANMMNRPVLKYERDDSSLGAAMLTGVALHAFSSHDDAIKKASRVASRTEPDAEAAADYDRLYPIYIEIHDDLVGTYHKY